MNLTMKYKSAAYLEKSGNYRTPTVMLLYHNLIKPRSNKDKNGQTKGKPKYDILVAVPKSADMSVLTDVVAEKLKDAFKKDAAYADEPFRYLNDRKDKTAAAVLDALADANLEDEFEVFFSIRSEDKPQIVGPDPKKEIDEEDLDLWLYSGALVAVTLSPYTYDTDGNSGCAFGLRNVQITGKGPKLALGRRRASADEEFEAADSDELDRGKGAKGKTIEHDPDERPRRARDEDEPRRRPREDAEDRPRRARDEEDEAPRRRPRDDEEPQRKPRRYDD